MITEANARTSDYDTREPDLIARAQQGDRDAFGELYAMHHSAVVALVRQRVGNHRQLAEDLTADVFLRAFVRLGTFAWEGKSLRAWLYTIARNRVIDHHKTAASKRLVFVEDMHDVSDYWAHPVVSPEETVLAASDRAELRAQIASLGESQKKVLYLRFFEGMSVPEAASLLERREGATKTLQNRAINSLRRAVEAAKEVAA
ncbi:RNA polymerase sigma factor [Streptomyces griseorubiginosus]|uniref:RNA polymerase sigma factor n=1 Tax=Streptomyces griseorubiginosus TaxID=67304 RepID=UPI00363BE301